MAHSPGGPPGGRKSPSQGPQLEDFGDSYEGDPTSISQIPQPGQQAMPPGRPSGQMQQPPQAQQPQMFPQGSPHLSHMGQQPPPANQFSGHTQMTAQMGMPGPAMQQVSG